MSGSIGLACFVDPSHWPGVTQRKAIKAQFLFLLTQWRFARTKGHQGGVVRLIQEDVALIGPHPLSNQGRGRVQRRTEGDAWKSEKTLEGVQETTVIGERKPVVAMHGSPP